jgi:hypothetical protein
MAASASSSGARFAARGRANLREPAMSGRLLNSTLLLTLSSFPALGLLLTALRGPFGGTGWAVLLVASALGSAALVVLARRARWSAILDSDAEPPADDGASERSPSASLWSALVVAAFLPVLVAVLGSPRVQISHHGFFHSAYVHQVMAGKVPPENVTLPGNPSNTYWPYHAVLAALVELFGVPAPLASALLNLVILAGSLAWVAALCRELYGAAPRGTTALRAVFGLFGANLLGGLYWMLFAAGGIAVEPRTLVLFGDVRLATLLAKFANYTGAALGVYFYVFGLLCMVRLLRGRVRGFDLVLGAMALLGALALHAITGAFMGAGFLAAGVAAFALTSALDGRLAATLAPGALAERMRAVVATVSPAPATAALAALLVLGAPVLSFVASASGEFPEPPRIGLPDAYALSVVAVSYPLLPLFLIGVIAAVRARDPRLVFLALVCAGGYALASVVSISGRNEYKFIYLGSVALCLLSLEPIGRWIAAGRRRPLACATAIVALLLACLNVATFGVAQLRGPLFADRTFAYQGRHVTAAQPGAAAPGTGIEYADAFAWIRDHTPDDTVVVVPLLMRDRSVLYVLSERVPYVVDGIHYNRGLPDFARRSAQVNVLYARTSTPDARGAALDDIVGALPGRPMVVVYPRWLVARFDPSRAGLRRVHDGRVASVYAVPGDWLAEVPA